MAIFLSRNYGKCRKSLGVRLQYLEISFGNWVIVPSLHAQVLGLRSSEANQVVRMLKAVYSNYVLD